MDCPEASGHLEAAGRGARRAGGKLPPHVVVYFVMALALFADEDYEEVAARLAETLRGWGCWERGWEVPTRAGSTQARQRLGPEPLAEVFGRSRCRWRIWTRPGRSWGRGG